MVVLATPTPTNNTEPTGGVHKPIHRFNTMIIPKWMGSIPNFSTTGKNMGVKIKTAGVMSIKIPTNNNNKLMINNITISLSLIPNKAELIF